MERLVKIILRLEETALTLILLGLAAMAFAQVFFRYVLNISFAWFEELGRYLGVLVAFLGASLGIKYGLHFSMDLVVSKLPRRAGGLLKVLTNLACGLFFLLVAYYAWILTLRIRRFGTTSAAMQIPMWWPYLPIPLFSLAMTARFWGRAWAELKAALGPAPAGAEEGRP